MPINPKSVSLFRRTKSAALTPGSQLSVDLDKGYDIRSVMLVVSGTITVTTAAATALKPFGMANILQRLEMFADGRRTFEETNGILAMFANFERQGKIQKTDPGLTVATHNVRAVFYLDRATLDSPRPKDSALHTTVEYMSLLQLRMQFGALSDVLTPDATTVLSSDLTIDVYQDEIQELEMAGAVEGRLVRVVSLQEIDVAASNTSQRVKLPTGNFLRGVKIVAVDDSGVGVDDVVNSVKIQRGTDVRFDSDFPVIREKNAHDYKIAVAEQNAGVAYADLCADGQLNKLYDLRSAAQADVVLDVTKPAGGDGKVYMAVVEYFEQAAAQA